MHDQLADDVGPRTESVHDSVLVQMYDLDAVAAAFCHRAGDPTAEAYRLATLHDVLDASRALAQALEEFARAGSAHHRGIHCTASMRAELERLSHRLASWSDAVLTAGTARREWQLGDAPAPADAASASPLPRLSPRMASGGMDPVTATPS